MNQEKKLEKRFNIKKIVVCLLGIMFVSFGLGAVILIPTGAELFGKGSNNYTFDDTKGVNIDGIKEINVDVSSASINIIDEGTDKVKAHLYGNISSSSNISKPELQCYTRGDILYVKVVNKHYVNFTFFYNSNMKLDVSIPDAYREKLSLHSASGDVDLSKHSFSQLNCKLSSGSMNMNNIKAETFSFDSSSGDIKAVGLTTKSASLDVSSGSINITKFNGDLKSRSASGDTKIEYENFSNRVDMHAYSGKIELKLPKNAEFNLDASVSSGNISCNFPIMSSSKGSEHELKGIVGSGKNNIKLGAASGDVSILQ